MSTPSNDVTKIGPVVCVDGICYGEFSVRKLVRDLAAALEFPDPIPNRATETLSGPHPAASVSSASS